MIFLSFHFSIDESTEDELENNKRISIYVLKGKQMLQKIIMIFGYALYTVITFYLIIFISWLFLPLILLAFIFFAWRYFQARRMWNELLKTQKGRKKRIHITTDDSIIDAEFEEIK